MLWKEQVLLPYMTFADSTPHLRNRQPVQQVCALDDSYKVPSVLLERRGKLSQQTCHQQQNQYPFCASYLERLEQTPELFARTEEAV